MGFSLPGFILCRSAAEPGPCALNSDPSAKKGSKGIPSSFWLRRRVAVTQGMKGEG